MTEEEQGVPAVLNRDEDKPPPSINDQDVNHSSLKNNSHDSPNESIPHNDHSILSNHQLESNLEENLIEISCVKMIPNSASSSSSSNTNNFNSTVQSKNFIPIQLERNSHSLIYRNQKFQAELDVDFLKLFGSSHTGRGSSHTGSSSSSSSNSSGTHSNSNNNRFKSSTTHPSAAVLTIALEHVFAIHQKHSLMFSVFTFQPKDSKKIVYHFETSSIEETCEWIHSLRCNTFKLHDPTCSMNDVNTINNNNTNTNNNNTNTNNNNTLSNTYNDIHTPINNNNTNNTNTNNTTNNTNTTNTGNTNNNTNDNNNNTNNNTNNNNTNNTNNNNNNNTTTNNTTSFGSHRQVLIFLNPFSGKKQGLKLFEKHVKPILDVSHLSYVVIKTERAHHALEYCATAQDLSQYTDIIGMGGDGIIFEIINGIGKRLDWKQVFQSIRIGHIPGGTSNALAVSAGSQLKSGKPASPEMAAFIVARGFYQPMDLESCFQAPNKHYLSFLSITWSAIADVDIGTENMRWLGGARNTVGALKQILTKKSYRGKLKYLHPSGEESSFTTSQRSNSVPNIKLNQQRYSSYNNYKKKKNNNYTKNNDHHTCMTNEKIQCPLLEQYFHQDFKAIAPDYCSGNGLVNEQNMVNMDTTNSTVNHENSISSSLTLTEIEDKFSLFVAANISHLSYDFIASPMAHHHDGYIDLVYVKDNISRGDFLNIFLAAEKGDHVFDKAVDVSKVKAFKLSPIDTGSYVVVDGEAVDYGDILVEVHPSMCNLLTL